MLFPLKAWSMRQVLTFFCNLPNEIEKKVEAVYNAEDWIW